MISGCVVVTLLLVARVPEREPEARPPQRSAPSTSQRADSGPRDVLVEFVGTPIGALLGAAGTFYAASFTLNAGLTAASYAVSCISCLCPPLAYALNIATFIGTCAAPGISAFLAWWVTGKFVRWRSPWLWPLLAAYGTQFLLSLVVSTVTLVGWVFAQAVFLQAVGASFVLFLRAGTLPSFGALWSAWFGGLLWAWGIMVITILVASALGMVLGVLPPLAIGGVTLMTGRPLVAGEDWSLGDVAGVPKLEGAADEADVEADVDEEELLREQR